MTDDKSEPVEGDVDPSGSDLGAELPDPGDYDVIDPEAEELDESVDDAEADPDGDGIDDPEQLLEAETAASRARSARPVKKKAPETVAAIGTDSGTKSSTKKSTSASSKSTDASKKSPVKSAKGSAKPVARAKRTTPVAFVGQSVAELRKVNWPTGDQLRQYFIVVLIFVVLIIAFVGLLDLGLGWLLLKLLGTPTS